MRTAFFDAQWAVLARRWPWATDEAEAMRFYRERLKARALHLEEAPFGTAVERLVARDWNNRPSVEQIVAAASPPATTYEPLAPAPKESIAEGARTLRAWRERNMARMVHPALPVAPKPSEILKERVREAIKDWRDEQDEDFDGSIPF